jgi:hypothetical protein
VKILLTGSTGYIAQRLLPVLLNNFHEVLCCVRDRVLLKIWSIGGKNGWYYGDWLWGIRGFIDKLSGGVGLRRGRKNQAEVSPGDALDFWRVLIADKREKRLLLYAEMQLPGKA